MFATTTTHYIIYFRDDIAVLYEIALVSFSLIIIPGRVEKKRGFPLPFIIIILVLLLVLGFGR